MAAHPLLLQTLALNTAAAATPVAGAGNTWFRFLGLGLLALLCLWLLSYNLCDNITEQGVRLYDESRHVASGVEMAKSGQFVVNTYGGSPDYWNTKPPLSMWSVAAGFMLPVNPLLGIRLFSLLSGFLAAAALFVYGRRSAGPMAGLMAVGLLFSVPTFILAHGARTADPDMLFTSLIVLAMLAFSQVRAALLALGYVLLGLAFLTKSFHVLPYLLAAFVYTASLTLQGQLGWRRLFLLPLAFLLPVLPWAIARHAADGNAFFTDMISNDIVGRWTSSSVTQQVHRSIYLTSLEASFSSALLAAAIALCSRHARDQLRTPAVRLLLLWVSIPFGVLLISRAGFFWYIYPIFPAVSLLCAILVSSTERSTSRGPVLIGMPLLLLGILVNETAVQGAIGGMRLPPLTTALARLGTDPATAHARVALRGQKLPWQQDDYATALLYGKLRPVAADAMPTPDITINPDDGSFLPAAR